MRWKDTEPKHLTSGLLCILLKLSRVNSFKYKRTSGAPLRNNTRLANCWMNNNVMFLNLTVFQFVSVRHSSTEPKKSIHMVPSAVRRGSLHCWWTHEASQESCCYFNMQLFSYQHNRRTEGYHPHTKSSLPMIERWLKHCSSAVAPIRQNQIKVSFQYNTNTHKWKKNQQIFKTNHYLVT